MKKNDNFFNILIFDYSVDFYYKIGLNGLDQLEKAYNDLVLVNSKSHNFKFGIFESFEKFKEISKSLMISIFYLENEPVGFFYNYLISEGPINISQQGLFVCIKNVGIDILGIVGPLSTVFVHEKTGGNLYLSTVSSYPSVIEAIIENSTISWPSYSQDCQRPPPEFKKVFELSSNAYLNNFVASDEKVSVDPKKFIFKFDQIDDHYPRSIKKMPYAKKIEHNLFLNFWLDYSKAEMLFMVSLYDAESQNRNIIKLRNKLKLNFF